MDTSTLILTIMTATLAAVTFQAWRLGNERRDVAALGVLGGLFGAGAATTALF